MDTSATTTDKPPVAFFKKRTTKSNLRKRTAPPPPDSDSQSESTEDESGARIKRRRKAGIAAAEDTKGSSSRAVDAASLRDTQFAADRSATIAVSDDATRKSNWFDEDADGNPTDASLLGTTRAIEKPATDGKYKGLAAYGNFIEKRPDARPAAVGPVKAPTNVRMVTITDFAPDVCKDYKLTGSCGFGDNCKYLHSREVYKAGWALDRDWEIQTKGKKQKGTVVASRRGKLEPEEGGVTEEEAKMLEKIPFACTICKRPYVKPVVTTCGHYFCEACALQRFRKTPNCETCGGGTGGVFNAAKSLQKLLDRKRIREEKLQEKELEGIDSDDDDE